jgi:pyruvate/2-oxoglutarate dehydrogenase complex dihydrolipoamide acyltransferase (E2) component
MKKYFVEKFNASDDSFRITHLYKQNGTYIEDGELLFSIESSKADIDIEAIESGFLYFNCVKGEIINVGHLFYVISKDVLNNLDEIFITKSSVTFEGISISNKASILLEANKIEPTELNKKIIKESDVLNYLKLKGSNEII